MKTLSKNNKAYKYYFILLIYIILSASCDEMDFLKEEPLDFYAPANSFITYENYEAAIYGLHAEYRKSFWENSDQRKSPRCMRFGTDFTYTGEGPLFYDYANTLVPESDWVNQAVWAPAYSLIYNSNVIINRVDDETNELTEDQKTLIKAEASFFRGLAYKYLANLYGGVPIVLEETTEPKRDFVRASRQEVYEQCATDLKFAAENLKDIDQVGSGRINRLAAYHVLSEVYITLERWDDAVNAASQVINHPNTALMTERFGSRINDVPIPEIPWANGGDVYWDLFRKGNQNREAGNTEAIWVLQFQYNVPGGGYIDGGGGIRNERHMTPRLWRTNIYNNDGSAVPLIPWPNTYYGGRGGGMDLPTPYFFNELWEKSGYSEDIRNADYSIIRDFIVNNPASEHNGKWVLADDVPIRLTARDDTLRDFHPLLAKAASMGDHPKDFWVEDQTVPGSITRTPNGSMISHHDEYVIRLAETYLLRAEAYLGKNDKANAVKDINEVRRRSEAPEVTAGDIDIDYILDERLRELYVEEFRLLTLCRLGKLVERTSKYNPVQQYYPHNNLWPIPFSEIEKNTGAELKQNPGY